MYQDFAAGGSGALVGFVLGLIGGGGSILAVPLLVYVVGVASPHVAIGTSAVSVAANAFFNLLNHWRQGNVRWPCAIVFTLAGVVGAAFGSIAGKAFDGQKLLFLFGVLMVIIGVAMLLRKRADGEGFAPLSSDNARMLAPKLATAGGAVGAMSGFFGIGGGFLIVPGLMAAAAMPMLSAVGTSLVAVTAFGLTTAVSYALSGLVNWRIAFIFIAAGAIGGLIGARAAGRLAANKATLARVFSAIVIGVGLYVMARGYSSLFG
ncbi:MAG: sulfite exporter TauE/SafE family protein [Hyphomicrobiales bacterium]|nr:sulfite exporter TauE/SafE family protein [Hyphomicrobiales bacterium]